MSKWRVRIEGAGGWAVFNPDRGSKRWFPTHAEALAYADRMARTSKPKTVGHPISPDALAKALSEHGYKLNTNTRRTYER